MGRRKVWWNYSKEGLDSVTKTLSWIEITKHVNDETSAPMRQILTFKELESATTVFLPVVFNAYRAFLRSQNSDWNLWGYLEEMPKNYFRIENGFNYIEFFKTLPEPKQDKIITLSFNNIRRLLFGKFHTFRSLLLEARYSIDTLDDAKKVEMFDRWQTNTNQQTVLQKTLLELVGPFAAIPKEPKDILLHIILKVIELDTRKLSTLQYMFEDYDESFVNALRDFSSKDQVFLIKKLLECLDLENINHQTMYCSILKHALSILNSDKSYELSYELVTSHFHHSNFDLRILEELITWKNNDFISEDNILLYFTAFEYLVDIVPLQRTSNSRHHFRYERVMIHISTFSSANYELPQNDYLAEGVTNVLNRLAGHMIYQPQKCIGHWKDFSRWMDWVPYIERIEEPKGKPTFASSSEVKGELLLFLLLEEKLTDQPDESDHSKWFELFRKAVNDSQFGDILDSSRLEQSWLLTKIKQTVLTRFSSRTFEYRDRDLFMEAFFHGQGEYIPDIITDIGLTVVYCIFENNYFENANESDYISFVKEISTRLLKNVCVREFLRFIVQLQNLEINVTLKERLIDELVGVISSYHQNFDGGGYSDLLSNVLKPAHFGTRSTQAILTNPDFIRAWEINPYCKNDRRWYVHLRSPYRSRRSV